MWNGTLGQARMASDGRVVTPCTFTSDDGSTSTRELFGADPNTSALAVIDELNAASDFLSVFQPGPVVASPVVIDKPDVTPTHEIVVEAPDPLAAFQQAVQAVNNLQRAVDLGLEDQKALDAAKAAAKALYSPEFLGKF